VKEGNAEAEENRIEIITVNHPVGFILAIPLGFY
jgi:hypothetical protein